MKKILIVEDEEMLRLIIKDAFEIKGFNVKTASNGKEALEIFESFAPDAIILDIMLPIKSGYEVAQIIRSTNLVVPILFLSAKSQTVDVLKGFKTGANDYVKKPFSIDELIVRILALLRVNNIQRREEYFLENEIPPNLKSSDGFVFMKYGNTLLKVNYNDITYIEAERDYANLFCGETKTLISSHLKELEQILPKNLFVRVHRSFIVSIKAISAIKGSAIILGKKEIPIGNNYREELYRTLKLF